MAKFKFISDSKVHIVFTSYPDAVRDKMLYLRTLVIKTAEETEGIAELKETLKWGEPSYVTTIGSTLRMDWKAKKPHQLAMYFQCTSRLVETFKLVFANTFEYEGKRAIIFKIDDPIPEMELKQCIKAALSYHKVKGLITLGI